MGTVIMPGGLNDHAVAIVMKELVRRAIARINAKRLVFEVKEKPGYDPDIADFVTDADIEAQAIYEKSLTECFPDYGIIAEEKNLRRPCRLPVDNAFFTVDPLDGTKAFIRRQSHGIGTMISLTVNGRIVCAYIGDVNTGEIYGFRAGSANVFRLTKHEMAQSLAIDQRLPLGAQYLLLRDPANRYSSLAQEMITKGVFSNHEVGGGSIGIAFARLWKSEIGAMILLPRHETPWDLNPVLGISEKMGFKFLSIDDEHNRVGLSNINPLTEIIDIKHETLVIHESRVSDLINALGYIGSKFV